MAFAGYTAVSSLVRTILVSVLTYLWKRVGRGRGIPPSGGAEKLGAR